MLWGLWGYLFLAGLSFDLTAQDSIYYWEQRMCTWSCLAVNDPSDQVALLPWEIEANQPRETCALMRRFSEANHHIIEWIPLESTARPNWMQSAPTLRLEDGLLHYELLESDVSTSIERTPPLFINQVHPDSETIAAWTQEGFQVLIADDGSGYADLGPWRFQWSSDPPQHRWVRGDSVMQMDFTLTDHGYYLSTQQETFPSILTFGGCGQRITIHQWEHPHGFSGHDPQFWDALNVSPTPSHNGMVDLSLASGRVLHADRVLINDTQGRPALQIDGPVQIPYSLDAQGLPPGHYSIQLQFGGRSLSGSLIRL